LAQFSVMPRQVVFPRFHIVSVYLNGRRSDSFTTKSIRGGDASGRIGAGNILPIPISARVQGMVGIEPSPDLGNIVCAMNQYVRLYMLSHVIVIWSFEACPRYFVT
jgi:hypothetical protein